MAIDVDKLIEDTKKKQAEAKKNAATARAEAEKDKASAKAAAESKVKSDYADTLRPRLEDYEARLRIYANRIARGDKFDTVEQREFDRLVKEYKSVSTAIDKAVKDSYDIVVKARKTRAEEATKDRTKPGATKVTTGPTGTAGTTPKRPENAPPEATYNPTDDSWGWFGYKDGKEWSLDEKTGKYAWIVTEDSKKYFASKNKKVDTSSKAQSKTTGDKKITSSGDAIPSSFDPAIARAGEEIDRPGSSNIPPKAQRDLKTLLASTEFWFDLPDYIFNLDPKLGELLVKAVNNNYDEARFLSEAKLTSWWQKNAAPIRTRIIAKAKYDELRAAGTDVGNTEYALDSATIKRSVQSRARSLGANLGPEQLDQIVSKIYNGFLENDTLAIDSFIAPYIGKITSIVGTGLPGAGTTTTGFSGQALQNYQTLQAIAKANGLSIRDILPGVSATTTGGDLETAVLQKLTLGELDINRIAQDARIIAGTGQPEYVRNLLNQGYDLGQVYSPYKNIMASVLELNPEEIELKELSGYGLFSDKGGSNIYDFKRALRKDSRWQYTEQAREEVADTTLGILRDFGFQG